MFDSFFVIAEDDQIDGNGVVSQMPNGTLHSHKSAHAQHRLSAAMAAAHQAHTGPRPPGTVAGLKLDLPLDDEDYLVPSPQSPFTTATQSSAPPIVNVNTLANMNNNTHNAYMDLLSDTTKGSTTM